VVARQDKVEPDALRALAQAVLRHDGVQRVALAGSPDGAKVALVVATGGEPNANEVVRALGSLIGGGGGGRSAELALAGGRDVSRIEEALAEARRLLSA
jgi:alanyl-tRNA synthetase